MNFEKIYNMIKEDKGKEETLTEAPPAGYVDPGAPLKPLAEKIVRDVRKRIDKEAPKVKTKPGFGNAKWVLEEVAQKLSDMI